MNNYIEVVITKSDAGFTAKSPMFKECEGIGPTQKAALSRLSTAIGQHIGKVSKKSFKTIFDSALYTDILFDTVASNDFPNYTQKRLYPLSAQERPVSKTNRVRLKSMQSIDSQWLLPHRDETAKNSLVDATMSIQAESEDSTDDTFLFGFPISFN